MMAKIHEVKLHAKYFDLVLEGKKRAEFRKKDRNYERGGTLILHEWVQGVFTGRKVEARISATKRWTCGRVIRISSSVSVTPLSNASPLI